MFTNAKVKNFIKLVWNIIKIISNIFIVLGVFGILFQLYLDKKVEVVNFLEKAKSINLATINNAPVLERYSEIIQDSKFREINFVGSFYTDPYKISEDVISGGLSHDCVENYANMTQEMDEVNNLRNYVMNLYVGGGLISSQIQADNTELRIDALYETLKTHINNLSSIYRQIVKSDNDNCTNFGYPGSNKFLWVLPLGQTTQSIADLDLKILKENNSFLYGGSWEDWFRGVALSSQEQQKYISEPFIRGYQRITGVTITSRVDPQYLGKTSPPEIIFNLSDGKKIGGVTIDLTKPFEEENNYNLKLKERIYKYFQDSGFYDGRYAGTCINIVGNKKISEAIGTSATSSDEFAKELFLLFTKSYPDNRNIPEGFPGARIDVTNDYPKIKSFAIELFVNKCLKNDPRAPDGISQPMVILSAPTITDSDINEYLNNAFNVAIRDINYWSIQPNNSVIIAHILPLNSSFSPAEVISWSKLLKEKCTKTNILQTFNQVWLLDHPLGTVSSTVGELIPNLVCSR